ncbi:hypothetical protein D7316_00161 [Gordonia insulae]|uniref:Uncharacterized protein n=1 Tax=Gordonia insulae TaxID=2420509 RepID=A0A3G8JGE9_9ACTN|nr:hypothetical protein D7316_00161 [Gordonia insulae]
MWCFTEVQPVLATPALTLPMGPLPTELANPGRSNRHRGRTQWRFVVTGCDRTFLRVLQEGLEKGKRGVVYPFFL